MNARFLLPFALLALAACSSSAPEGPSPADTGPPDADRSDAEACTGSLEEAAGGGGYLACKPTYAEALAPSVACRGNMRVVSTGTCGGGVAFVMNDEILHFERCFYASDAAGAPLVGAIREDDVKSFCGGTSTELRGGNVPEACSAGTPVACPGDADGGRDAASD